MKGLLLEYQALKNRFGSICVSLLCVDGCEGDIVVGDVPTIFCRSTEDGRL